MREAVEQTDDLKGFETMLQEQQSAFKVYLYDCCHSETPAPRRFEFLQIADYHMCNIRLMCADSIREKGVHFYRFWSKLSVDTRRFISTGIKILDFQLNCPPHLLTEPTKTFPEYKWAGTKNDLTEGLVALHRTNVIRLRDGTPISFVLFAKFIGSFFGITYHNPHDDMRKVLNRKKETTPFLQRLIESMKGNSSSETMLTVE
jgi:hypothetical protein